MSEEFSGFSGVTIVIFIACGVLTFFLLFLFAKREITRFALKNRRGPHVLIGHDAPKSLRRELDNRLNRISEFRLEPRSLQADGMISESPNDDERQRTILHSHRIKAVDDVKAFEERLREKYPSTSRKPLEGLRPFLIGIVVGSSSGNKKNNLIHSLCDIYDHARHNPKEFGAEELNRLSTTLTELQQQL